MVKEYCKDCDEEKEIVDVREENNDTVLELECGKTKIKHTVSDEVDFEESLSSSDKKGGKHRLQQKGRKARIRPGDKIVLEGNEGWTNTLLDIPTSKKKQAIDAIEENIGGWLDNPKFKDIEEKEIDLGLVLYVNENRMNLQDVDNIAKVVIDALQDLENGEPFLVSDDSQVRKLLVDKRPRVEEDGYKTDDLYISFREHSDEPMILKSPDTMSE